MALIINDKKQDNISSFLAGDPDTGTIDKLNNLLKHNNLYIKADKEEEAKIYMNDIWGNIYIYGLKHSPFSKIEINSETASLSSSGVGRYDITHKDGTQYSIFM